VPGSSGSTGIPVFDGATPNLQGALQAFKDHFHLWQISGTKGLTALSLEGVAVAG